MKIVKKNFIIERGDAYLDEERLEIRVPGDWTTYKCSLGVKLEKLTPSSNLLIRKRNTLYNGSDDELEAIYDGSDTCFKISIQKEDTGDFLEPKYYWDLIAIDPSNGAKTKTLAKGEFKVEFDTQTEFDNTQLPTDAERYIAVLASAFGEDTLVYKTGTTFAATEFTATEIASAITQAHVHENIEVINATTASFTTELLGQLQATLSATEIAELLTNYYTADEVDDFLLDKINTTEIGVSIASLVDGKVPITQLPTNLLDDYVEYANYAALPVTGETDLLYITINDNKLFRWTGSVYVEVSPTHTHSNKAILDEIDVAFTSTLKTGYDGAVTASHGHSNKEVLDNIDVAFTTSLKTNYDAAYNALHSHTNKANLDTINQALATTSAVAFSTMSIGNATLGSNALAVTGTSLFNNTVHVIGSAATNSNSIRAGVAVGAAGRSGSVIIRSTLSEAGAAFDAIRFTHYGNNGFGSNSNYLGIDYATNNTPAWSTAIAITGIGNVGFGTNAPSAKLEIAGTGISAKLQFFDTDISGAAWGKTQLYQNSGILYINGVFANEGGTGSIADFGPASNINLYRDVTISSKVLQVTGTGNSYFAGSVGIGTTAPNMKLEVNGDISLGSSGTKISQLHGTNAQLDINPYQLVRFGRDTNNVAFSVDILKGDNTPTVNHRLTGVGDSYLAANNGKVGIGTMSPSDKLHISGGNIRVVQAVNSSGSGLMIYSSGYSDYINIYSNNADVGIIQSADTTTYRALSLNPFGGNVGIGLTNPSSLLTLVSTGAFAWDNGSGTCDVILRREAANTLALRNSTNAQTFNIYNTYTDASNYERGYIKYASNILYLGHEGVGTGLNNRILAFTTNSNILYWDGSAIYTGNNSRDLGKASTNVWRTGYFGTSIINAGYLEVGSYIKQTAIAATSAVNNSTFIDSADNKLKFKDNSGTVKEIAFV
ncbi:hypothetical protein C4588_07555 [Candidatus Parcubacteria bacterium]|jgi:hypothetical protein|nr:MAG: hypothetical protein C4588_07555 [Candidatus Parcubacteria bacterium]